MRSLALLAATFLCACVDRALEPPGPGPVPGLGATSGEAPDLSPTAHSPDLANACTALRGRCVLLNDGPSPCDSGEFELQRLDSACGQSSICCVPISRDPCMYVECPPGTSCTSPADLPFCVPLPD